MATGRGNTLTGQLAEHLVCAELARRGLISTTFAHNVPAFDVLAADERCRTVPIQVKATRSDSWRREASHWMKIRFDEAAKTQTFDGETELATPDLIWVCVAVAKPGGRDRFFILREQDVQQACITNYCGYLNRKDGRRPVNWRSLDCWWEIANIERFENNWDLIVQRLRAESPDPTLEPSAPQQDAVAPGVDNAVGK